MFEDNSQKKFSSKKLSEKQWTKINWKDKKNLNTLRFNQSEIYSYDQTHNVNP